MKREDVTVDLLGGIHYFVATVDNQSFARAAREFGVTASAVSRRVAKLEDELGVRLLMRTTRTMRLTDDGRAFHLRCTRILEELSEARSAFARARARPSGTLRVDMAAALTRVLTPHLPTFVAKYPDVRLELSVRDQLIDPVTEGVDVALRLGPVTKVSLIAKKLAEPEIILVASPAYLRRAGTPASIADLERHQRLGYLRDGRPDAWSFGAGGPGPVPVDGAFHSNDIDALRALALSGRGIVQAFDFLVADELRRGTLVRVLGAAASFRWPLHALYPPIRHLLPKVRVFLDLLDRVWPRPRR